MSDHLEVVGSEVVRIEDTEPTPAPQYLAMTTDPADFMARNLGAVKDALDGAANLPQIQFIVGTVANALQLYAQEAGNTLQVKNQQANMEAMKEQAELEGRLNNISSPHMNREQRRRVGLK